MPVAPLLAVAVDFTPRFEVLADVVLLDVSGLSRLLGGPHEMGDYLSRAASACDGEVRVAVAPTAAAAVLLALGRPGLTLVSRDEMGDALAALPVGVLRAFERIRLDWSAPASLGRNLTGAREENIASGDGSAYASLGRDLAGAREENIASGGGWAHPRDTHQARQMRRQRRAMTPAVERRAKAAEARVSAALDVLRRWGIATLGALAALSMPDVSERLGDIGTRWQRLARGEDDRPLVPWVPEEPFEATLDLEWPIDGLEPLSFALTRLLDPLAARLERAGRGAAVVHTRLRLVTRAVHARQLQLPAPMREAKTLGALILLDLESNPPPAAIDRVGVLIEPTPGRVLQWALFERAQPSPEQVSTLLARLAALMGQGRIGSPRLVDSWEPGVFTMEAFAVQSSEFRVQSQFKVQSKFKVESEECKVEPHLANAASVHSHSALTTQHSALTVHAELCTLHCSLRRFRLPVLARVVVHEGRPVRVQVDRRGLDSGAIVQAAGPWRTSGGWWQVRQVGQVGRVRQVGDLPNPPDQSDPPHPPYQANPPHQPLSWDRDEWDVALGCGTVYRLFMERDVGQWFIEGVID